MNIFSKIFKGGSHLDCALALDIGTEVVKALVFKIDSKKERGLVVGVGKIQQKLGNMQSGAVSDISGVIETSQRSIGVAKKKGRSR